MTELRTPMAQHLAANAKHTLMPGLEGIIASEIELAAIEAQARANTYASVLRGLRSEDDSPQLRAIIASVEADASPMTDRPDVLRTALTPNLCNWRYYPEEVYCLTHGWSGYRDMRVKVGRSLRCPPAAESARLSEAER